ncbi:hypothetical protein JHK85_035707 [Glycine max]|nr:hypothetical protein JHK85_035707 [Glycine max]
MRKDFKSLSKDYKQFQGQHEENIDNSSKISTQSCDDFESLKLKTVEIPLENEVCKERSSLLEDLQKLKNQLEGIQNERNNLVPLVDQDDIQQRRQKKLARTVADEDKALEIFGLAKKVQRILREQQGLVQARKQAQQE